jgi:uncharacterized membrane protein YidH (DUF202 family)
MDLFSTKIAYAAGTRVDTFVHNVDRLIINPIIYLLFALAILIFLYGVFEFLLNQANEEKKTTGKSHMIWGIIGITIMLGVWSIMGLITRTLGVDNYIHPEQGKVDSLPEIKIK